MVGSTFQGGGAPGPGGWAALRSRQEEEDHVRQQRHLASMCSDGSSLCFQFSGIIVVSPGGNILPSGAKIFG